MGAVSEASITGVGIGRTVGGACEVLARFSGGDCCGRATGSHGGTATGLVTYCARKGKELGKLPALAKGGPVPSSLVSPPIDIISMSPCQTGVELVT